MGVMKNRWELMKQVAELQFEASGEDAEPSEMIGFDYNGQYIVNPFLDEVGQKEVDPIEYYGDAFLNSNWVKIFGGGR